MNQTPQRKSSPPILRVEGLTKHFPVHGRGFLKRVVGTVKAVDNVSFQLHPSETMGLVGESGCGKTTVARSILRALKPSSGKVFFTNRDRTVDLASLKERDLKPLRQELQMIFQDPFSSLNPRMTVGEILGEPLKIHRLAQGREMTDRVCGALERVGLKPEHRSRYPHAFSGGQRQRIGIARALMMDPSLVIADEAVSALDVSVQAQVINLLMELQEELGLSYIFVAHDLSVVKHISNRIAVMYAGKIVELAETELLFQNPLHPYTQGLLAAVPQPDPDVKLSFTLTGEVADPAQLPPGCSFHPRCPFRFDPCARETPPLVETRDGRWIACHKVDP